MVFDETKPLYPLLSLPSRFEIQDLIAANELVASIAGLTGLRGARGSSHGNESGLRAPESANDRIEINRAYDRLERLQRRREGELVPPSLNLNVNAGDAQLVGEGLGRARPAPDRRRSPQP